MNDRTKFIKQAESWMGAVEGDNKYAQIIETFNSNKQGYRYDGQGCCEFTVACALKTFGVNQRYIPVTNYAKAQSRMWTSLRKEPSIGALAYFDYQDGMGISHVEIVYRLEANRIYTIDGNNRHKVTGHVHSTHNGYIVGYGTPNWKEEEVDMDDFLKAVVGQTVIKKGDRGTLVLWMQKYLQRQGFYMDGLQDGIFGEYMFKQTKLWQKSVGLVNDGVIGKYSLEYILSHAK